MTLTVIDVGNCDPDHAALSRMLKSHFQVEVLRAHQLADALEMVAKSPPDLVLVNRKLDIDYSDGMEIIKHFKATPELQSIPIMLVTNYPDHQQAAVAEGALYGFGKLEYNSPTTLQRLEGALGAPKL